jgi:hypothetical protein
LNCQQVEIFADIITLIMMNAEVINSQKKKKSRIMGTICMGSFVLGKKKMLDFFVPILKLSNTDT